MKRILTATIAAMALTAGVAEAKTEIKVASIAPEGTPWIQALKDWEKNVETATSKILKFGLVASTVLSTGSALAASAQYSEYIESISFERAHF